VFRDGKLQVDNGNCHTPRAVLFFSGKGPSQTANCKPNEVDVPELVGQDVQAARARLTGQPLTPEIVYRVAKPGQRLDVVLEQRPKGGRRLSAYDRVTLVVAKPTHGKVPRLVGMPLERAQRKCARRGLRIQVEETSQGKPGRVVFQLPRPGVAAAPGMTVRIAVAA
jgi:beta-lactam-binding protein with PASTA domain